MSEPTLPSNLSIPPELARSRLEDQIRAGERLRSRAAEVDDLLALPPLDIKRMISSEPGRWLEQTDLWVKKVDNVLQDVFVAPQPLRTFRLAEEVLPPRSTDEESRFRRQRNRLQLKLDALRRILQTIEPPPPKLTVFLVHGRDHAARDALMQLLEAFSLRVLRWREAAHATGNAAPSTLDVVDAGMELADAVVVLLTPDDLGRAKDEFQLPEDDRHELELTGQPRLNVVFEAGMALALGRRRVVLVQIGYVRPMSDTHGINVIRLTDTDASRLDLRQRLKTAGLDVAIDDAENAAWRHIPAFTVVR